MSGYCLKTSTIPTMSDYEEDFGDFPSEYKTESKESLVGAYRAESRFDFSAQRDARMDNLPMSALSEEQRRIQFLAHVAQENAEIITRGEAALDPNTTQNRERWNTTQVSNHEVVFPYSDNLITLMFIVASE